MGPARVSPTKRAWGFSTGLEPPILRLPKRVNTMSARDDPARLLARYSRITDQLRDLFETVTDPLSRMASVAALVQAKMPHHSWTGFYRIEGKDLLVGPYQGPLACLLLERGTGVCWATVREKQPIVVPDVHAFEGHIACDPRTQSEVVVPVLGADGAVHAVLDVDSTQPDAFTEADVEGLEMVAALIYA